MTTATQAFHEIERIELVDSITGEMLGRRDSASFFPSSHYMNSDDALERALGGIQQELDERLVFFRRKEKLVEADRLARRTRYDLELLRETGFCPGIENYSRHLDGRRPGEPPATLLPTSPYYEEPEPKAEEAKGCGCSQTSASWSFLRRR